MQNLMDAMTRRMDKADELFSYIKGKIMENNEAGKKEGKKGI